MPAQAAHALQSKRDGHLSLAEKQEKPIDGSAYVLLCALCMGCTPARCIDSTFHQKPFIIMRWNYSKAPAILMCCISVQARSV